MAIYVGVDQSYTGTGVVALNELGSMMHHTLIKTKPGKIPMDQVDRLGSIFDSIVKFIKTWDDHDVALLIEDFAFGQANQMAALGGLGWHLRYRFARETDYKFGTCPVGTLKKFATGKGQAKKDQMLLGIYKRWGFEAPDDNTADAFALSKLAWMTYAKPAVGTAGTTKDDHACAAKVTIYR